MRTKKLTQEDRVRLAIELLEQLSAAREDGIEAARFMTGNGLQASELEEIFDLIRFLAHRESGSRVDVENMAGRIALKGESGRMLPLRLSVSEGMVLRQLLNEADLSDEARGRLEDALVRRGTDAGPLASVASTSHYGPYLHELAAFIEDGVRIRLGYRSSGDTVACTRTVDPLRMEIDGGYTYLVGWDTKKEGYRHYRLDRITSIEDTQQSVEKHANEVDMRSDLLEQGKVVRLSAPKNYAESLNWLGIVSCDDDPQREGRSVVTVAVTSETWLFGKVLASGGAIRILDDTELRERFCAFARSLRV